MGLFGGGNSTTQNVENISTRDQRQTVQSGQAVNSGGGQVVIQNTSTPQGAFHVARAAIDQNGAVAQAGLDLAGQSNASAFDLAGQAMQTQSNALDHAINSANSSSQLALQTLQAAGQPAAQTMGTKLITLGIPALALVLLFKR